MSDEVAEVETEARKPGRPRTKERAMVAYIPGDGDPNKVVWNGVEFRANVAIELPSTKTVRVSVRKEYQTPEGDLRSRSVDQFIPMIELAKGNPSFSVDGVQSARRMGSARLPVDNDQYRGYALAWIRDATSLSQLTQRWDAEESLRDRCGCDTKDIQWLRPFLEARREEVREAA